MRVLVTDQHESDAMELAKKLGCKSITYGQLPHLFGEQELPFVYDESEVYFSRSGNMMHHYRITTRVVKKKVPWIVTEEVLDEWTGSFIDKETVLTRKYWRNHYRLGPSGEVIKEKVSIKIPMMFIIEEDEEVIEEITKEGE